MRTAFFYCRGGDAAVSAGALTVTGETNIDNSKTPETV